MRVLAVWAAAFVAFVALVFVVVFRDDEPQRVAVAPTATACKSTKRLVIVNLDNRRHRGTLRHAWAAIAHGEPEVLHIDRDEADEHRDESLRGIPLWSELGRAQRERLDPDHWWEPHDRDEFPPAASREGGRGADVAYVLRGDNRSAGQSMGAQLAAFCEGQRWRYERKPGPRR